MGGDPLFTVDRNSNLNKDISLLSPASLTFKTKQNESTSMRSRPIFNKIHQQKIHNPNFTLHSVTSRQ